MKLYNKEVVESTFLSYMLKIMTFISITTLFSEFGYMALAVFYFCRISYDLIFVLSSLNFCHIHTLFSQPNNMFFLCLEQSKQK